MKKTSMFWHLSLRGKAHLMIGDHYACNAGVDPQIAATLAPEQVTDNMACQNCIHIYRLKHEKEN